jgi:hypothetical protein
MEPAKPRKWTEEKNKLLLELAAEGRGAHETKSRDVK